jgi:PIN domain nuclease of toxin-antitoxin system
VRLLLDTQIAIWWLAGSSRLAEPARKRLIDNRCEISVASVWEVAIKYGLGKLPIAPAIFRDELAAAGVPIIPVLDTHAIGTTDLPKGHSDPFDRLLISAAMVEGSRLITADEPLLAFAQAHGLAFVMRA